MRAKKIIKAELFPFFVRNSRKILFTWPSSLLPTPAGKEPSGNYPTESYSHVFNSEVVLVALADFVRSSQNKIDKLQIRDNSLHEYTNRWDR
jgi:hypothetical protein